MKTKLSKCATFLESKVHHSTNFAWRRLAFRFHAVVTTMCAAALHNTSFPNYSNEGLISDLHAGNLPYQKAALGSGKRR